MVRIIFLKSVNSALNMPLQPALQLKQQLTNSCIVFEI